ncbi:hypothetical protein B0I35DRAFT_178044 [Stachybotrys elegans]|uniref:Uncharacterized protein n=1 Tax=Stachybotrys elegans TaxID=80388 RepID=A0A8K0SDP2_9HYPO|nr:hypothetical protein B0I35DRAFT_178044 [Stachybotrys elegans]
MRSSPASPATHQQAYTGLLGQRLCDINETDEDTDEAGWQDAVTKKFTHRPNPLGIELWSNNRWEALRYRQDRTHPRENPILLTGFRDPIRPEEVPPILQIYPTCKICHMEGNIQPILPPLCPYRNIAVDFIAALPATNLGLDVVMMFVDKFSKEVLVEPTSQSVDAPEAVSCFEPA